MQDDRGPNIRKPISANFVLRHNVDVAIFFTVSIVGICNFYLFSASIIKFTFGIFSLLVFPGYLLLSAMYPNQEILRDRLPSLAGLSLVVNGLLSLIITYTFGLNLANYIIVLLVWLILCSSIAILRRSRNQDRHAVTFEVIRRELLRPWENIFQGNFRKLKILAVVFATIGIGRLIWVTANTSARFAEFYVLGPQGKAGNYSLHVAPGEDFSVIVGVLHHGPETKYEIIQRVDDQDGITIEHLYLFDNQKWEQYLYLFL